jgi:WD40 repeat protein
MAVDDAGRVRLIETESGREIVTLDSGTGSTANFFCLAFSRDGGYLAAGRDHMIHLWDLRLIREQLASLGLDWSAPPLPPKTQRPTFASVELVDDDNPRLPGERDGAPERTSPKQPVNDKNSPCDP